MGWPWARMFCGNGGKVITRPIFPKVWWELQSEGWIATRPQGSSFPFLVFQITAFQEDTSLMITIKINNITCHQHPLGGQYLWDSLFNLPCFPAALWSSTELGNLKTCGRLPSSWSCFCIRLEEREMQTTLIFFFPFPIYHLCCVGDPDAVAAGGDLAVMRVAVLFQGFSVDETDAEASCCRGLTKSQVLCQGPPHASAYLFYIHFVQGS